MAEPILLSGNVIVSGSLVVGGDQDEVPRSRITQDVLAAYMLPWKLWTQWNDMAVPLPSTSANDDLGLYGNTFGTGSPAIETYDVQDAGALTLYARTQFQMPPEYDTAKTVQIRAKAGMVTNVADNSCTIDFQAYESDNEAGIGADLVTTAATTMNSLTAANKDFTVTASGLLPGDWLDIRMAVAVNDAATGAEVIARIGYCAVLMDIRG